MHVIYSVRCPSFIPLKYTMQLHMYWCWLPCQFNLIRECRLAECSTCIQNLYIRYVHNLDVKYGKAQIFGNVSNVSKLHVWRSEITFGKYCDATPRKTQSPHLSGASCSSFLGNEYWTTSVPMATNTLETVSSKTWKKLSVQKCRNEDRIWHHTEEEEEENMREFQEIRSVRYRQQWGIQYPEGVECVDYNWV